MALRGGASLLTDPVPPAFYVHPLRCDVLHDRGTDADGPGAAAGLCDSTPAGPAGGVLPGLCRLSIRMVFRRAISRQPSRQRRVPRPVLAAMVLAWHLAVTMGLMLYVHRETAGQKPGHDSKHCTVCQGLALAPKDCLAPPADLHIQTVESLTSSRYIPDDAVVQASNGRAFAARPPPVVPL